MNSSYGDILIPSALILPHVKGQGTSNLSGSIGISGANLVFFAGGKWNLVTSS